MKRNGDIKSFFGNYEAKKRKVAAEEQPEPDIDPPPVHSDAEIEIDIDPPPVHSDAEIDNLTLILMMKRHGNHHPNILMQGRNFFLECAHPSFYCWVRHCTTMAILSDIVSMISGAFSDRKNLPRALVSCGVLKAAAALCLLLFKAPGGIFLHHGKGPLYLYFAVLIAVVIFGIVEALVGVWVSGEPDDRHAVGKTVLWVSILPLVFVAALGGFSFL